MPDVPGMPDAPVLPDVPGVPDVPGTPDAAATDTPMTPDGGCTPGMTRLCYSGPDTTRAVGACRGGIQVCTPAGVFESACFGEVVPASMEACGNGVDDDCNGMVDDACGECAPGTTRDCYTGTAVTAGVGRCRGGRQVCDATRRYGACTGETTPAPMETCGNGVDDNCDGMVDNGCGVCTPGNSRACYSGPDATAGVGRCRRGTQICNPTGAYDDACIGEVAPSSTETCGNGVDDDCNGTVDDGCGVCTPGTSRMCYSGPTDVLGVGRCRGGAQVCNATRAYDATCAGETLPAAMETCGNRVDDDCDGTVDNGCGECTPGTSRTCYTGPSATAGVGRCRRGAQICNPAGAYDAACLGEATPAASETCGNGIDDDCNGTVDDGCGVCTPGATRACYSGVGDTLGVGRCRGGTQLCNAMRAYDTACTGEVTPAPSEACGNGVDDDCDGSVDEGCGECTPGTSRPCYSGAAGTAGVGRCARGLQLCNAAGAYDAACLGETTPAASETCGNGIDDDCNGTVDNGCGVCTPGATRACYTGATGTLGVGRCRGGAQLCNTARTYDAACTGEVAPASAETCGNGVDDDCDGSVDEGCGECTPGTSRPCYTGLGSTAGVGRCARGVQLCNAAGAYDAACLGEVTPASEVCGNGADDNCDGTVDDGCGECVPGASRVCYSGPSGTSGRGLCRAGTQACGTGRTWSTACLGEVLPATESCNGSDDDCNGLADDGAAPASCTLVNATAACASGACAVAACTPGYGDCDRVASNGCEVAITTSTSHCGACGRACGAGQTCAAGVCLSTATGVGSTLAVGMYHACAVLPDGRVACWGYNDSGQLGSATLVSRVSPQFVVGLSDAVSITAGAGFNCALRATGAVSCWGSGTGGQLGDGTTASRSTPGDATGIVDALQVSAGNGHACAVRRNGRVLCWGTNGSGQLGDGTTSPRPVPSEVPGITDAVRVAAGSSHTCVVQASGAVSCWGANGTFQLGDGTSTQRTRATVVPGLSGVAEIAAGTYHTCVVRTGGTMACWGYNTQGQVGDASIGVYRPTPSEVLSITDAVEVAVGVEHTCARRRDGTMSCWGAGANGQIGDGAGVTRTSPVAVPSLASVARIAAGATTTCAARTDGTAICWGYGGTGELGDGRNTSVLRPTFPVFGVPAAQMCSGAGCALSLSVGDVHGCSVRPDGTTACWGSGGALALGDGSNLVRAAAVAVAGLTSATQVACGQDFTCARLAAGGLRCWGQNGAGQLGDGTTTTRPAPTAVSLVSDAVEVAAGVSAQHACARTSTGTIYCWGLNSSGQLGDGSTGSRVVPTLAGGGGSPISDATAVAVGGGHTCAIRAGGALWCWGANGSGQLGDGTATARTLPVAVRAADGGSGALTGVSQVSIGGQNTCVLRSSAVLCWGDNLYGQLGNGSTLARSDPGTVPGISDAVEVRVGLHHACARRASGALVCWGRNANGQVGDGTTAASRTSPTAVLGIADAVGVAAGNAFTCARRASGAVVCWGLNSSSQLAIGTATSASAPGLPIFGLP